MHFTHVISHCTLKLTHYTICTMHSIYLYITLHTEKCTMHTQQFRTPIAHCRLHNACNTLQTWLALVHFSGGSIWLQRRLSSEEMRTRVLHHCALCTVLCTMYCVLYLCALCTVNCEQFTALHSTALWCSAMFCNALHCSVVLFTCLRGVLVWRAVMTHLSQSSCTVQNTYSQNTTFTTVQCSAAQCSVVKCSALHITSVHFSAV